MTTASHTPLAFDGEQPLEFLAFKIGQEEYGIDIQSVQELRGYDAVTRIANAPEHVKGVTNLRGVIVPIVDLRIKFGQPEPTYDALTVVVVVNHGGRAVGMVVDAVSDVISVIQAECKPAPAMGQSIDTDYTLAIATLGERLLALLDVGALLHGLFSGEAAALAA
ncbi:chemotaxis protein CheW [Duganella sp. FT3S]|uniref:Chemotaxis protein CheW n=1 Tax=Rugamonas fusca TaxID=2758568 RepID=A0A7W2EKU6_9BURK|nr:chemotaxis protein CheW [Rugamonas fusca]MBA5607739.1 chemotaxis protein CheW [Rugamonas fusca]